MIDDEDKYDEMMMMMMMMILLVARVDQFWMGMPPEDQWDAWKTQKLNSPLRGANWA